MQISFNPADRKEREFVGRLLSQDTMTKNALLTAKPTKPTRTRKKKNDGEAGETERRTAAEIILSTVADNPAGATTQQILAALKASGKGPSPQAIKSLKDTDKIRSIGRGLYQIAA